MNTSPNNLFGNSRQSSAPRIRAEARPGPLSAVPTQYFLYQDIMKNFGHPQSLGPQLIKKMNHPQTGKAFWEFLRFGLMDFCKSPKTDGEFIPIERKEHLDLPSRQLGFPNGATYNNSPQLDAIWIRLIQEASKKLMAGKPLIWRLLRTYVEKSKKYLDFYVAEIEGRLFKPNTERIDAFFDRNDPNKVNTNHYQFVVLLARLTQIYFKQYENCIKLIVSILRLTQQGQFPPLFQHTTGQTEKSFLSMLWEGYSSLSTIIITHRPDQQTQILKKNHRNLDFGCDLLDYSGNLLINYLKLFYKAGVSMSSYQLSEQIENIGCKNIVVKIGSDIAGFYRIDMKNVAFNEAIAKLLVELFLLLFPFQKLYLGTLNNQQNDKLRQELIRLDCEYLRPLVVMVVETGNELQRSRRQIRELGTIARGSGEWPAVSFHWKNWLGVMLRAARLNNYRMEHQLRDFTLQLIKQVAAQETQLFWIAIDKASQRRQAQRYDDDFLRRIKQGREADLTQHFYLYQIEHFLIDACRGDQSELNFSSVAPVLIKLLGNYQKNYTLKLIDVIGTQTILENVVEIIHGFLGTGVREQISKMGNNQNQNEFQIEQSIKFICKLVELNSSRLDQIECMLLQVNQENTTGLLITRFLLTAFQTMAAQNSKNSIVTAKCLRYLFNALTAIFINISTRKLLPLAIGVVHINKSFQQALFNVLSLSTATHTSPQLQRQSRKLKKALCSHLIAILRHSDSLQQFFPSAQCRVSKKDTTWLNDYINQDQQINIVNVVKKNQLNTEIYPVPWFYTLLLVLNSDHLGALELQLLNLCLMKLKVSENCPQYYNMLQVVEIINNGNAFNTVLRYLYPIQAPNDSRQLFGLLNREWQLFQEDKPCISLIEKQGKYRAKHKRHSKIIKLRQEQRTELYHCICHSMNLITTLLTLHLSPLPILSKLNLCKQLQTAIFQENLPFQVKLEIRPENEGIKSRKKFSTENVGNSEDRLYEVTTKVNLIHVIASLIDFEARMGIDVKKHPAQIVHDSSQHVSVEQLNAVNKNMNIIFEAQGGILQEPLHVQTLGISCVFLALQNLIQFNHGRQVFMSIASRSFPKVQQPSVTNSPSLQSFIRMLVRLVTRTNSPQLLQHIFQFLAVCLTDDRLADLLLKNLFQFREGFGAAWKHLNRQGSLQMTNSLLLLFHKILLRQSDPQTVKFVKFCIPDTIECTKALLQIAKKLIQPAKERSDNIYELFFWRHKNLQAALIRTNLLLLLSLFSYFLALQQEYLVVQIVQVLIGQSKVFLSPVPPLTSPQLLQSYGIQAVRSIEYSQPLHYLTINDQFLSSLVLRSPHSISKNFLYQTWQSYFSIVREGNKMAHQAIICNTNASLVYSQKALTQFYSLMMLSIFQRGRGGFYLNPQVSSNSSQNSSLSQMQSSVQRLPPYPMAFFGKVKSPNGLSGAQMLEKNMSIPACIGICRSIQHHIWNHNQQESSKDSHSEYKPDLPMLLFAQMLNTIRRLGTNKTHISEQNSQAFIQTLLANLRCRKLSFSPGILGTVVSSAALFLRVKVGKMRPDRYYLSLENCLYALKSQSSRNSQLLALSTIVQIQANKYQQDVPDLKEYAKTSQRLIFLTQLREFLSKHIASLGNGDTQQVQKIQILNFIDKCFYLDAITNIYNIQSLTKGLVQQFFRQLSNISNPSVSLLTSICSVGVTIALYQSDQHQNLSKLIEMILPDCQQKMKKLSSPNCLSDPVVLKNIFNMAAALGTDHNWQDQSISKSLEALFMGLQAYPVTTQAFKINPFSSIEIQLSKLPLMSSSSNNNSKAAKKTVFEVKKTLRLYDMFKQYLLFSRFALENSRILDRLCNSTLQNSLDRQVWIRLSRSFMSIAGFLSQVLQLTTPALAQAVVLNTRLMNQNTQVLNSDYPYCLYDQKYVSEIHLKQQISQGVSYLAEAVRALLNSWKRYEWKDENQIGSDSVRSEMIKSALQVVQKSRGIIDGQMSGQLKNRLLHG